MYVKENVKWGLTVCSMEYINIRPDLFKYILNLDVPVILVCLLPKDKQTAYTVQSHCLGGWGAQSLLKVSISKSTGSTAAVH
jgi:hypothetical protein